MVGYVTSSLITYLKQYFLSVLLCFPCLPTCFTNVFCPDVSVSKLHELLYSIMYGYVSTYNTTIYSVALSTAGFSVC